MKQTIQGLKRASGSTKNKTPFTYTVLYDKGRNRVFAVNDKFHLWNYTLEGQQRYIKLLEGSRHFTMREIAHRVEEYWRMVHTWEIGLD